MIEAASLANIAGIAHGFFTRKGGHSDGLFRSLNCGYGSGDDRSRVGKNRAEAANQLNLAPSHLVSLYQVHSPTVVVVREPWTAETAVQGDGMVTNQPGIGLGVLTADCAPIIFAAKGVSAVGIAHAGWKGALAGITSSMMEAMEQLGAKRSSLVAVIGPTISKRAYEVGSEYRERFVAAEAKNATFFTSGNNEKYYFDLPGYLLDRIQREGIAEVHNLDLCTYSDEEQFFSFRRSVHREELKYGRLLSAVAIRG